MVKTKTMYTRPTLVINIEREFFADILARPRRKAIEYRDVTPYWERRLENVGPAPFDMRILNGMTPPVPEATVRVTKVVRNRRYMQFELHIGAVLDVKNWDRDAEEPLG